MYALISNIFNRYSRRVLKLNAHTAHNPLNSLNLLRQCTLSNAIQLMHYHVSSWSNSVFTIMWVQTMLQCILLLLLLYLRFAQCTLLPIHIFT